MHDAPDNLTIGLFAKAAGVNLETIRFYQRKGLLADLVKRCDARRGKLCCPLIDALHGTG